MNEPLHSRSGDAKNGAVMKQSIAFCRTRGEIPTGKKTKYTVMIATRMYNRYERKKNSRMCGIGKNEFA